MVQFNVPKCFSGDCDCEGTPPPSSHCPYGDCLTCRPSECSGPKCCCCSSIDVVLGVRARCYDRVFFSCNQTASSPGPSPDSLGNVVEPFPAGCTECQAACARAIGGDEACASISQHTDNPRYQPSPADWYSFFATEGVGPCDCNCASFVDPSNPSAGCNLTCVTCSGLSCNADVSVTAGSCAYQFNITPGDGCCGTPAPVDVVFAIDYSKNMALIMNDIITSAGNFADEMVATGALPRFGLLVYGKDHTCLMTTANIIVFTNGEILTTDVTDFKQTLTNNLPTLSGSNPDFEAAGVALQTYPWDGAENFLFIIGNEPVGENCGGPSGGLESLGDATTQPSAASLSTLANSLNVSVFTVQPFSGGIGADTDKTNLSTNTSNGRDLDITLDFSTILDTINFVIFGSSCDCLDRTPVPIELCKGGISPQGECIDPDVNIPIGICTDEFNSDCGICNEPMSFNVCGEIIVVEPDPDTINLVCCGELGGGCNCPTTPQFPPEGCCGIACSGIDICPPSPDEPGPFSDVQTAIDSIWCECWNKASAGIDNFTIETVGCSRCTVPDSNDPDYADLDINALENCVIKVPDGLGGTTNITRSQIAEEVTAAWAKCQVPGDEEAPPSLSEATCLPDCDRQDECITGSSVCGNLDDIRDCRKTACSNDTHKGCTSVRNPATAILNNGIGLVAYESMENVSVIKIEQFNTSVPAKILPNRRTNYGRLQHSDRWESQSLSDNDFQIIDFKLAKLYYFEALPTHFLNGISGPPAEGSLVDTIVFRNGPLQNQCFSLDINPIGPLGIEEGEVDDIGNFVRFTIPDGTVLSNSFTSLDDVYNIEWFLIDSDDTGLVGSSTTLETISGFDLLLSTEEGTNVVNVKQGMNAVNVALELSPHIHDGKSVPVAYPSLAVAHNYMNAVENSHYVYLVYQALENQKWNLYMRQLRLSEYSREEEFNIDNTESLQGLGITELVYRVVCVTDECEAFGNDFLAKRTATFEIVLQDGREVFNEDLLGSADSWNVCPGEPEGSFLKKKVVVSFTHSVLANRCPDQFEINELFYNWEVGDEFSVPFTELTADNLFTLLKKPNDNAVALGEETVRVSGIIVTSSQVAAIWYDDHVISIWVTPNNAKFQDLLQYKGLDTSEPIPITEFEEGHCTHPVVALNTNNEVFVTYECTDPQVHQVHITGTVTPSTSFPLGIFSPKNLDANLDFFLSPQDFKYRNIITSTEDGINQLPDIHIDANDVIHITWQSNRDDVWEIYYGNSENQFQSTRITDFKSKSLKPSITGDVRGNLHIAWHDNRFGDWEIMMAYRDDERVLTLLEQDPYLAGVRNAGYSHTTDIISLTLTNPSEDESLCVSELAVRFFSDRLLTKSVFDVPQSKFPVAFTLPDIINDRTTGVWDDLDPWIGATEQTEHEWWQFVSKTIDGEFVTSWGPMSITVNPNRTVYDFTLDSQLAKSDWETITMNFTGAAPRFIRFGSNDKYKSWADEYTTKIDESAALLGRDLTDAEASVIASNLEWDQSASGVAVRIDHIVSGVPLNIPALVKNFTTDATQTTLPPGRYKTIKLHLALGEDLVDIESIEIGSVRQDRICISPGGSTTAFLDLTPSIRVDAEGNETVESPLPVAARKNTVYFISVFGVKDDGRLVVFDDPKKSVSCETCTNDTTPWDASSCTYSVSFLNSFPEQEVKFINARIRFYTDQTQQNLVAQFDAFSDGDLEVFTTGDNEPAQNAWTDRGLEIFFGKSKTLTLWPMLSNTVGLLCGVEYWVTTETCTGNLQESCERTSLDLVRFESWICNCGSARWETQFENAPTNIRDTVRWISSGDGFSDTRLTETGPGINNYNPIIKLRTDLTGIVVYESNRDDPDLLVSENEKHTLYGTAFSVFPGLNMYATGAESITSKFGEILVQSDVPITACPNQNCPDDSGPAMEGRNPDFVFDQYDNIFLAAERFTDQSDCLELSRDSQRSIVVHRCGIQAKNLAFTPEEFSGSGTFACDPNEILGKTAPLSQDKTFQTIIKMARVNNKFAQYHITRSKKPVAVVNQCKIEIDIITEPGTIAVRLKNENDAWSTWFPFDPEIGDNTIRIPWSLVAESGVKNVTIEAATYQGLSTSFSLSIIADYKGVDHAIKFYKLANGTWREGLSYDELLDLLALNSEDAFVPENLLQNLEGVPVAGIRQPIGTDTVVDGEIIKKTGEFIFVEIIPSQEYLEDFGISLIGSTGPSSPQETETFQTIAPTFDVLQQGAQDLFLVPTIFDSVNNVFKGVFPIQKEDQTFYKDGLSFVIPHFREDCGDIASLLPTEDYIRDQFNLAIPEIGVIDPSDVWGAERDEVGKIKHQINIRGTEDPYFVFGDPNYRVKKQHE